MDCRMTWLIVAALLGAVFDAGSVELTFELPDNAKECFHQEIEKNVSSTLEFQVSFQKKKLILILTLQKPQKFIHSFFFFL